ncbi:hypothetical protein JCM17843_13280 [Kordiimonadales bacterium JCM 17843]|nr:hypothetical protein JCM17843_13280 [Kordiimonadales bacterium JCM 17843]
MRGGLMDLEFIVQYLLLREGARHPQIFTPRLDDCLDHLVTAKALDPDDGRVLKQAHSLYHAVQSLLRLTLGDNPDEDGFVPELRAALARATAFERFEDMRQSMLDMQARVFALYHKIIERNIA